MNIYFRIIQEKASGQFFVPDGNGGNTPIVDDRAKAWLYREKESLAVIRAHYGGDHGADLVTLHVPEPGEVFRWMGRKGGLKKSTRKTKAVRKNGRQPKRKSQTTVNVSEPN